MEPNAQNGNAPAPAAPAAPADNSQGNQGGGDQNQNNGGQDGGQQQGNQQQQTQAPPKGTGLDNLDFDAMDEDLSKAQQQDGQNKQGDGGQDGGQNQGGDGGQGDGQGQDGGQGGDGQGQDDQQQQQDQGDQNQGDQNQQQQQDQGGDGGDKPPVINVTDPTVYWAPEADENYGIAPLEDLPEPDENTDPNTWFKEQILPRVIQAVRNVVGVQQKNYDSFEQQQTKAQQEAQAQKDKALVDDINAMVENKVIPKYEVLPSGQMNLDSEGGKVVKAVLQFMHEHNSKPENKNAQLTSFKMAHQLWSVEQQKQQAEADKKKEADTRKEQARRIGGSSQNNQAGVKPPVSVRKGATLDDIEFE